MMLKSDNKACPITAPARHRRALAPNAGPIAICVFISILATGCQQGGGPAGARGQAPISQLPGQAPMTGPTMPSLGPFGASARVPPPATGSYGNPSNGGGAPLSTTPAGYAPSTNIQAMSYQETGGNPIAVAGGATAGSQGGQHTGAGWEETSTNPIATPHSSMNFSTPHTGLRGGGMPVNDLTGAPPPPGYVGGNGFGNQGRGFNAPPQNNSQRYPNSSQQGPQPIAPVPGQYPATGLMPEANHRATGEAPATNQAMPRFNTPATSRPISGGGYVDSSPAANQPAFSTADRPVQWQSPR